MSVRISLLLSNELNAQIERAAMARDSTKAEVLSKAIAMYLVAVDGKQRGLRIGLAREDQALETEFVGL
jgi:predicted transcriptional regulator